MLTRWYLNKQAGKKKIKNQKNNHWPKRWTLPTNPFLISEVMASSAV